MMFCCFHDVSSFLLVTFSRWSWHDRRAELDGRDSFSLEKSLSGRIFFATSWGAISAEQNIPEQQLTDKSLNHWTGNFPSLSLLATCYNTHVLLRVTVAKRQRQLFFHCWWNDAHFMLPDYDLQFILCIFWKQTSCYHPLHPSGIHSLPPSPL